MRKSFWLLGVVLMLIVLEFAARGCTDHQVSRSIQTGTDHVGSVTFASGDVPLLWYLYVRGHVSNGTITLHDVTASPTGIAMMHVTSAKMKLSRSALLSGKAEIPGDGPYSILVVLSKGNVRDAVHGAVAFHGQMVQITSVDTSINTKPEVKGRKITFKDGADYKEMQMPNKDYLPCTPTSVSVQNALVLSCQSDTMPKAIAQAVK